MCNMRNSAVRKLMSTFIKDILEHFSLALTVFQILYIIWFWEILWPWKYRSRSCFTTFAVVPFDGKYLTFYLTAIEMFASSLAICKIFQKIIKCKQFWTWNVLNEEIFHCQLMIICKWWSRSRLNYCIWKIQKITFEFSGSCYTIKRATKQWGWISNK